MTGNGGVKKNGENRIGEGNGQERARGLKYVLQPSAAATPVTPVMPETATVRVSLEIQTANATTAILTAIEQLPARMAVVAFQNAQRIIEAARRERGEDSAVQPEQPIAAWNQETIEAAKQQRQAARPRRWWRR